MSPITFIKESRARGVKKAFASFRRRRHLLPVIAYLFLALMTAYTFNVERQHSNQNRVQLASETRSVLLKGCVRGNELRVTLQEIIRNSAQLNEAQINRALANGQITQAQVDQAHKFTQDTLRNLSPVDCLKAYPVPKTTG